MNKPVRHGSKKIAPEQRRAWGETYQILHSLLERRHYLQPFIKEFHFIDAALARYLEQMPDLSIGKYKVQGFYKEADVYNLPPALKAKYARRRRSWMLEITKQGDK